MCKVWAGTGLFPRQYGNISMMMEMHDHVDLVNKEERILFVFVLGGNADFVL